MIYFHRRNLFDKPKVLRVEQLPTSVTLNETLVRLRNMHRSYTERAEEADHYNEDEDVDAIGHYRSSNTRDVCAKRRYVKS